MKNTILFTLIILSTFILSKNTKIIVVKTNIECSQCKDRILKNLAYEDGIQDIEVDVESKTVKTKFDSTLTNVAKIRLAISKIGYDADSVKANPKARKKLPACCRNTEEGTKHHH